MTKATYLPPNGCITVLYVPLEEAISRSEDRALPASFSLAFLQPQALPSLGKSFHGLWLPLATFSMFQQCQCALNAHHGP